MQTPSFFQKLFHIYTEEQKPALIFSLLGFLWAFSAASALKLATSLFLFHLEADLLPIIYLSSSGIMMAISIFLLSYFQKKHIYSILQSVYLGAILLFLLFYGILNWITPAPPFFFWAILRVCCYIIMTISLTNYWNFLDYFYTLRNAKRTFTLFNSSVFLGFILAGTLLSKGWLTTPNYCLLIAASFFLSKIVLSYIFRYIQSVQIEEEYSKQESPSQSIKQLIYAVISSPFTLVLLGSNFLIELITFLTEFNFQSSFELHFQLDTVLDQGDATKNPLTLFLGSLTAYVALGNFLFGLLGHSRLAKKYGVHNLILITPFLFLFLFSGWMNSHLFFFPIIAFVITEGVLYALEYNNFNLTLHGVPNKFKGSIRLLLESFFEPLALFASGGVLSLFSDHSILIGMFLSLLLLALAITMRQLYHPALLKNLTQEHFSSQQTTQQILLGLPSNQQEACQLTLLSNLEQNDEKRSILAVEILLSQKNMDHLLPILKKMKSYSHPLTLKVIRLLEKSPFSKHPLVLDHLKSLFFQTPSLSVKAYLALLLSSHHLLYEDDLPQTSSTRINLFTKAAHTILCYRKNKKNHLLLDLLHSPYANSQRSGLIAIRILKLDHLNDSTFSLLDSPHTAVLYETLRTFCVLANKKDQKYISKLFAFLKHSENPTFHRKCLQAMQQILSPSILPELLKASLHLHPEEIHQLEQIIFSLGAEGIPLLKKIFIDPNTPNHSRLIAAKVLGDLCIDSLRENLIDVLSIEAKKASFFFYHAYSLNRKQLKECLLTSYQMTLNLIIQVLDFARYIENGQILINAIHSPYPKVRSHAIENLEQSCPTHLFVLLHPLIDEIPLQQKLRFYIQNKYQVYSLSEVFYLLSRSPSILDRLIAANATNIST